MQNNKQTFLITLLMTLCAVTGVVRASGGPIAASMRAVVTKKAHEKVTKEEYFDTWNSTWKTRERRVVTPARTALNDFEDAFKGSKQIAAFTKLKAQVKELGITEQDEQWVTGLLKKAQQNNSKTVNNVRAFLLDDPHLLPAVIDAFDSSENVIFQEGYTQIKATIDKRKKLNLSSDKHDAIVLKMVAGARLLSWGDPGKPERFGSAKAVESGIKEVGKLKGMVGPQAAEKIDTALVDSAYVYGINDVARCIPLVAYLKQQNRAANRATSDVLQTLYERIGNVLQDAILNGVGCKQKYRSSEITTDEAKTARAGVRGHLPSLLSNLKDDDSAQARRILQELEKGRKEALKQGAQALVESSAADSVEWESRRSFFTEQQAALEAELRANGSSLAPLRADMHKALKEGVTRLCRMTPKGWRQKQDFVVAQQDKLEKELRDSGDSRLISQMDVHMTEELPSGLAALMQNFSSAAVAAQQKQFIDDQRERLFRHLAQQEQDKLDNAMLSSALGVMLAPHSKLAAGAQAVGQEYIDKMNERLAASDGDDQREILTAVSQQLKKVFLARLPERQTELYDTLLKQVDGALKDLVSNGDTQAQDELDELRAKVARDLNRDLGDLVKLSHLTPGQKEAIRDRVAKYMPYLEGVSTEDLDLKRVPDPRHLQDYLDALGADDLDALKAAVETLHNPGSGLVAHAPKPTGSWGSRMNPLGNMADAQLMTLDRAQNAIDKAIDGMDSGLKDDPDSVNIIAARDKLNQLPGKKTDGRTTAPALRLKEGDPRRERLAELQKKLEREEYGKERAYEAIQRALVVDQPYRIAAEDKRTDDTQTYTRKQTSLKTAREALESVAHLDAESFEHHKFDVRIRELAARKALDYDDLLKPVLHAMKKEYMNEFTDEDGKANPGLKAIQRDMNMVDVQQPDGSMKRELVSIAFKDQPERAHKHRIKMAHKHRHSLDVIEKRIKAELAEELQEPAGKKLRAALEEKMREEDPDVWDLQIDLAVSEVVDDAPEAADPAAYYQQKADEIGRGITAQDIEHAAGGVSKEELDKTIAGAMFNRAYKNVLLAKSKDAPMIQAAMRGFIARHQLPKAVRVELHAVLDDLDEMKLSDARAKIDELKSSYDMRPPHARKVIDILDKRVVDAVEGRIQRAWRGHNVRQDLVGKAKKKEGEGWQRAHDRKDELTRAHKLVDEREYRRARWKLRALRSEYQRTGGRHKARAIEALEQRINNVEQRNAAIAIQSGFRGYQARKELARLKEERDAVPLVGAEKIVTARNAALGVGGAVTFALLIRAFIKYAKAKQLKQRIAAALRVPAEKLDWDKILPVVHVAADKGRLRGRALPQVHKDIDALGDASAGLRKAGIFGAGAGLTTAAIVGLLQWYHATRHTAPAAVAA